MSRFTSHRAKTSVWIRFNVIANELYTIRLIMRSAARSDSRGNRAVYRPVIIPTRSNCKILARKPHKATGEIRVYGLVRGAWRNYVVKRKTAKFLITLRLFVGHRDFVTDPSNNYKNRKWHPVETRRGAKMYRGSQTRKGRGFVSVPPWSIQLP